MFAFVRLGWYDGTIEKEVEGWGFSVNIPELGRTIILRRNALVPLVNTPKWEIEFNIG